VLESTRSARLARTARCRAGWPGPAAHQQGSWSRWSTSAAQQRAGIYSDDRELLRKLAAHAAPAVRIALLLEAQRRETEERERIQQELQVAQLVQKTLLPSEIPDVPGYNLAWHYQPARAVGGDFYDFIALRDGKVALVIADVTDKGVPAALVMATTRATLRAACRDSVSPGEILGRANEYLCPDIPPKMFVTMAVWIRSHRRLCKAGIAVYVIDGQIGELRARGMPLGLPCRKQYSRSAGW
jgi:serine phosphatase RsbU (regulator of sigma subunit)